MYKVYPHHIFYGWQEYPGILNEQSAIETAKGFVDKVSDYDEVMVIKKSREEGDSVIGIYRNENEGIYKRLTKGEMKNASKNQRR